MENNLKILEAQIENFKNLTKKEVDTEGGRSLMIVGKNDGNKSSLIQALFSPFLDTYKPIEPIKKGEDNGSLQVKIGGHLEGEEVEYTVNLYFSREQLKGRLTVLNKNGENVPSPKSALEAIIGDISFDIDRFIQLAKTPTGKHSNEGVKKQIEMLKKFLPKEIQQELDQCDIDRKQVFNDRKALNAEIKVLESQSGHSFTEEEIENYSTKKPEDELNKKLADIGQAIENHQTVTSGLAKAEKQMEKFNETIPQKYHFKHQMDVCQNFIDSIKNPKAQEVATVLAHVNKFKSQMQEMYNTCLECEKNKPELEKQIKKGEDWLKKNPKPTTESMLQEQKEIQDHNRK